MQLHEFYAAVTDYREKYPEQRAGQALFNVLHDVRPDISEAIRGTSMDPFHAPSTAHPSYTAAVRYIESKWYGAD